MGTSKGQHQKFTPHPIAASWPRHTDDERIALQGSIQSVGLQRPIVVLGNQIIDGIGRYEICQRCKIPLKTEPYTGDTSDAGILQAVIAFNGGRNLNTSQRAMIAAESLPRFESIVADRKREIGKASAEKQHGRVPLKLLEPLGEARKMAANLFAVSASMVGACKKLLQEDRKLAHRVKNGELKVSQARARIAHKARSSGIALSATSVLLSEDDCQIIVGDCIKKLESLPRRKVNLVFADPPYNLGQLYNGYDDDLPENEFLELMHRWIMQLPDVLTPNGSAFVMMGSRHSNLIGVSLRTAGLHRQDEIIWAQSFGNYNSKFWTDNYRVIHHYTAHPSNFTFNYQDVRAQIRSWRVEHGDKRAASDTMLPGNVWGVWTDQGIPRLVGLAAERIRDNTIRIPNQLPVALVERIVLVASNPGDLVLDPFHGTGTTARACLPNGRKYIGIEIDKTVAERSKTWIKSHLAKLAGKSKAA